MAGLAAGCVNLAPPYQAPALAVAASADQDGMQLAVLPWRAAYTDARLRQLIALSLENNRDLRIAGLNLARAREQYQVTRAAGGPAIDAGANASRSKDAPTQWSASLGLAAYELDFFGRVRNLDATALQDFLARDATRRSVQISLVAETANAWLALAADLQRQALARRTLDNLEQGYALTAVRVRLGATGDLPLTQAGTAVQAAKAELLSYSARIAQARHALDLVAGCAVPAALLPQAEEGGELMVLAAAPAGVSSTVLQRRPDVQAAEHALQGAYANIGVVRAARFPRIALTGAAGSGGDQLARLFQNGGWNAGAALSVPVFDGGAGRANVRAAGIDRDLALARYDRAVQTAFAEVADALAVAATLAERLAVQQALLNASRRQLALAEALYRTGGSSQLELLYAQRQLFGAESGLVDLRQTVQVNRITVYKVLGGG